MKMFTIQWILNGCGLEGGSITGGPVRFHEISRRWQSLHPATKQRLMTTPGGKKMLSGMGCEIPATIVRASLVLRHEPFRAFRFWSYIISAISGRRAVKSLESPDVVITVSDYFCDIVPALAFKRRMPGCRWVAWIHHRELPPAQRPGNRAVNTLTWKMQEWSLRRIARHADSAWVYDTDAGDLVKARLLAFGMDPGRIRIMRCGINLRQIADAPSPVKTFDAAMVGVRPNKGLYDIIPIWEKVLTMRPGTTLRLMGGMSGEAGMLAEIKSRGLGDFIVPFKPDGGFLPAEQYYAKLKEARILFAPSHEEGWGMAVCEAMAAGLPVAAYDLPVYKRIYGNAFRAVPCFDHDKFAEAIASLLDVQSEFESFRERGLACAEKYDWDEIAKDDSKSLLCS